MNPVARGHSWRLGDTGMVDPGTFPSLQDGSGAGSPELLLMAWSFWGSALIQEPIKSHLIRQ